MAKATTNALRTLLATFIESALSGLHGYDDGECTSLSKPESDSDASAAASDVPIFVLIGVDEEETFLIEIIRRCVCGTASYYEACTAGYPGGKATLKELTQADALGLIQEFIWRTEDYEAGSIAWVYLGHNCQDAKMPDEPEFAIRSDSDPMKIRAMADTML